MFVLCRLRSMVRLPPDRWSRPLPEALKEELNRRLANTVLHKVRKRDETIENSDSTSFFLSPSPDRSAWLCVSSTSSISATHT